MSKNVSNQLVETLVEAGIQKIYALTGDNLNQLNEAVHRNVKITAYAANRFSECGA